MNIGQKQQNLGFGDCSTIVQLSTQQKKELIDRCGQALRVFPNSQVHISTLERGKYCPPNKEPIAVLISGGNNIAESVLAKVVELVTNKKAIKGHVKKVKFVESTSDGQAQKNFDALVKQKKGSAPQEVSALPAYYA